MSSVLHGVIVRRTPYVLARIHKEGHLEFELGKVPDQEGRLLIIVDTGFTGGIALPMERLQALRLDFYGYQSFRLADQRSIEFPIYLGKVKIGPHLVETRFIPGHPLMGMELLQTTFTRLHLDFKNNDLLLTM